MAIGSQEEGLGRGEGDGAGGHLIFGADPRVKSQPRARGRSQIPFKKKKKKKKQLFLNGPEKAPSG